MVMIFVRAESGQGIGLRIGLGKGVWGGYTQAAYLRCILDDLLDLPIDLIGICEGVRNE